MDVKTLDRDAQLAVVGKGGIEQFGRNRVRVAIIEHNRRIIAAQFQRQAFERICT